MLEALIIIFLLLWLLGGVGLFAVGSLLQVLLIVAVILLIVRGIEAIAGY
jgi:hypothetical protein